MKLIVIYLRDAINDEFLQDGFVPLMAIVTTKVSMKESVASLSRPERGVPLAPTDLFRQ
jgi:hypothetical protein